jgi:hypothetical protein
MTGSACLASVAIGNWSVMTRTDPRLVPTHRQGHVYESEEQNLDYCYHTLTTRG